MSAFSLSFFPEREQAAPGAVAKGGAVSQLAALLKNPTVSESCSIEFLSGATGAMYSTFILLVAGSLPGLTNRDGVTVILIDGLVSITCLFFGARLFCRLSRRQTYAAGLTLAVAALTIAANATGLPGLILGGMLLATGSAMVHIVNMVLLSQIPGEKSKASGLYQLSSMLGAATGALSGGLLSHVFGLNHLFASWVPILLLCTVPIWLIARRTAPHALTAFTPQGGTHGS
jgi:predicted MFS family arabinose efflux permease